MVLVDWLHIINGMVSVCMAGAEVLPGVILCFLEYHFDFAFVLNFQIRAVTGNIKLLSDFQLQIVGFYHFLFIQQILYGFISWRFCRFRLFRSINGQR